MIGVLEDTLVTGIEVCLRLEELHPKGRMEIPSCEIARIEDDEIYINTHLIDKRYLEGRRVEILWERENYFYCMTSKIEKCIYNKAPELLIHHSDILRSLDTRRYIRFKRLVHIEFRPYGLEDLFISAETNEMSGEGIRFLTNYPLIPGQRLDMLIEVPIFPYLDTTVFAQVKRIERIPGEEGFKVEVGFEDIDSIGKKRLLKYMLDEQDPLKYTHIFPYKEV